MTHLVSDMTMAVDGVQVNISHIDLYMSVKRYSLTMVTLKYLLLIKRSREKTSVKTYYNFRVVKEHYVKCFICLM